MIFIKIDDLDFELIEDDESFGFTEYSDMIVFRQWVCLYNENDDNDQQVATVYLMIDCYIGIGNDIVVRRCIEDDGEDIVDMHERELDKLDRVMEFNDQILFF